MFSPSKMPLNVLTDESRNAAQMRNVLRLMLKNEVFKFGSFTLKSGQVSPIYIDLRSCFGDAKLMDLVSSAIASSVVSSNVEYQGVVGVPYGALPYAAIASAKCLKKPFVIVRKEAKAHGTKKLIEGCCQGGDCLILVEDVVTTGGSIKEVVKILRDDGLLVDSVFCILDREQGGREALQQEGINLYSLLNLETILVYLHSIDRIDASQWQEIVKALNLKCTEPRKVTFSEELEDVNRLPLVSKPRLPLEKRLMSVKSSVNEQLFGFMNEKQSNLCLAIDYTEKDKILALASLAAPYVVAIKLHADAIVDFDETFAKTMRRLADDEHFLIFEDRKFADIGATNVLQLRGAQRIADWADIVTVHAIAGRDAIQVMSKVITDTSTRLAGILLIAQLSCAGSLTALEGYAEAAREMAEMHRDIVAGFICQTRISAFDDFTHWTPGVNLDARTDNSGQQWRGADEAIRRQQNDIVIVGRGVTASSDPKAQLERYKLEAWRAFEESMREETNGKNGIH